MSKITPLELHASSCNFTGRVSASKSLSGCGFPELEMPFFKFIFSHFLNFKFYEKKIDDLQRQSGQLALTYCCQA